MSSICTLVKGLQYGQHCRLKATVCPPEGHLFENYSLLVWRILICKLWPAYLKDTRIVGKQIFGSRHSTLERLSYNFWLVRTNLSQLMWVARVQGYRLCIMLTQYYDLFDCCISLTFDLDKRACTRMNAHTHARRCAYTCIRTFEDIGMHADVRIHKYTHSHVCMHSLQYLAIQKLVHSSGANDSV